MQICQLVEGRPGGWGGGGQAGMMLPLSCLSYMTVTKACAALRLRAQKMDPFRCQFRLLNLIHPRLFRTKHFAASKTASKWREKRDPGMWTWGARLKMIRQSRLTARYDIWIKPRTLCTVCFVNTRIIQSNAPIKLVAYTCKPHIW
jgi:hypothetical protein